MILIYALVAILFGAGLFMLMGRVLSFEDTATIKLMRGVHLKSTKGETFVRLTMPLIKLLAVVFPMSNYTQLQYKAQFQRLGITMTPEVYVNSYRVRSLLIALCGCLFIPGGLPLLTLVVAAIAVIHYLQNVRAISDKIAELNTEIMSDLPRLISMLVSSLSESRDYLSFFVKYRSIATPALAAELDTLIVDMETGNHREALRRFDARIRIYEVSQLVALISGVNQGGDQKTSLMLLEQDIRTKERARMEKLLAKNPRRVRTACFIITTLMIFLFMVPIGIMILDSLQGAGM